MRLEYLLFREYDLLAIVSLLLIFLLISSDQPSSFKTVTRDTVGGYKLQIRSSAWLEHYTDNVGVSSSNLLGSTNTYLGG